MNSGMTSFANSIFLSIGRESQGVLGIPSAPQSLADQTVGDPVKCGQFRPFRNGLCGTKGGNKMVASCISSLLSLSCPSAVFRAVISVVVGITVQCMFWAWRVSHIIRKVGNGLQPPLADFNASPSVVSILWLVGIKTSLFHLGVDSKHACISHAVSASALSTPATRLHAVAQFVPVYPRVIATSTFAPPAQLLATNGMGRANSKMPKHESGHIYGGWMSRWEVRTVTMNHHQYSPSQNVGARGLGMFSASLAPLY